MRILAAAALSLLANNVAAQTSSGLSNSFEMMRAQRNVDAAIANLESGDVQPACMDAVDNYVFCVTAPDDIDDTTFLFHPVIPSGLVLGTITGSDYEMGAGMVNSLKDALGSCDETGQYGLATYDWLSQEDFVSSVSVTSLVMDTVSGGETVICASGPLSESSEAAGDSAFFPDAPVEVPAGTPMTTLDVNNRNLENIPNFEWAEAPPGANYDFVGNLEMCGGVANHIGWPEYFATENISGAIFAYRQFGVQTGECGADMAPLLRLTPGKTYKINFINSSGTDTNLHTHGLHIGGNYWSDDVFRTIPAGMCGVYYWEIVDNHASGMHWYHPHLHGFTFEQVRGRAFGPLFVEEIPEVKETYPVSIQKWLDNEVLLQMSTDTVPGPMSGGMGVKDGRCPNTVAGENDFTTCYSRANNKRMETVTMIRDEWYYVTIHNIVPNGTGMDVVQFFDGTGLETMPCTIMIVGYDGVYRSSIPRAVDDYPEIPGYFHCNGASRVLLAMKCSGDASMKLGKEDVTDEHYQMSTESDLLPILVKFNIVDGETTEASPYADEATMTPWVPPRPQYLEDLTAFDGEVETWESKTKLLGMETGDRMQMIPVFNDETFEGGPANHVATFGAVQEWAFFGTAGAPEGHPMHVHVNHMQIYGYGRDENKVTGVDCGPNFEFGEWYDTIRIKESTMDPCLARFRFNDFSGKVIMHCHDLMHEDGGMMGWVSVVGGPQDDVADIVVDPIACENLVLN